MDAYKLLSEFTRLRQSGVNRDEAWYLVCDSFEDIDKVTQQAFLNLAKDWERRVGYQYQFRDAQDIDKTLTHKEIAERVTTGKKTSSKLPTNVGKPRRPRLIAALTGALNPQVLRKHEQKRLAQQGLEQLEEIKLSRPENRRESKRRAPFSRASRFSPKGTARMQIANDFFGPNTKLQMYFKDYPRPLMVTIGGENELYIGRVAADSPMAPEIDLTPVHGAELGVSRIHAAIARRNNKLLIADMGSVNFTHVNGIKLQPNDPHTLKDSDEIWFGQLRCQIRFQHQ